jgi:hypothetical protein
VHAALPEIMFREDIALLKFSFISKSYFPALNIFCSKKNKQLSSE